MSKGVIKWSYLVKAQMVGFYRQGADEVTIAAIFDVSTAYVDLILRRYFDTN
jgi:hypothetical protein